MASLSGCSLSCNWHRLVFSVSFCLSLCLSFPVSRSRAPPANLDTWFAKPESSLVRFSGCCLGCGR